MRTSYDSRYLSRLASAQDTDYPVSLFDSFDDTAIVCSRKGLPVKLLSPPTVPSQCCSMGAASVAGHCRVKCTARSDRALCSSYDRIETSLNLTSQALTQFQDPSRSLACFQEPQAVSGLSSSPSISASVASSEYSPPSSCKSISLPAEASGTAQDWQTLATKDLLEQAFAFDQYDIAQCGNPNDDRQYVAEFPRILLSASSTFAGPGSVSGSLDYTDAVTKDVDRALHSEQALIESSESSPSWADGHAKTTQQGKPLIVCDMPGCQRLFANIYNLNDHRRTHMRPRDRPHSCPLPGCPKKYFYRRDLVRHLRKHHSAVDMLAKFSRSHSRLQRHRSHTSV